jgi:hypothetical protein
MQQLLQKDRFSLGAVNIYPIGSINLWVYTLVAINFINYLEAYSEIFIYLLSLRSSRKKFIHFFVWK